MRFFNAEIDGCGHPSILSPKGPGKPQEAQGLRPPLDRESLPSKKLLSRVQEPPKGFKKPPKKPEAQDLPDPLLKMRFFNTNRWFRAPLHFITKRSRKAPKSLQGLPKGVKSHQKASKSLPMAGSLGFARPAIKNEFFSAEIDGFGRPSILSPKGPGKHQKALKGYQKGQESHRKPPRNQKALKATKRL